ncbi:MAG: DUF177 domain-containing protein [Thermodesulfobacteriota bacterium]|nr:DUF177 domain-containing protein [Thermodesulfobacteriota bacterium]
MPDLWLSITDIPAEGREFSFADQTIWSGPWSDYGLSFKPGKPLEGHLEVVPQRRGCLVRGRIFGSVVAPCDRCAEDVEIEMDSRFKIFESLSGEDSEAGESLLREKGGKIELNAAGLLWEQFVLALPVKPLCKTDCKGLCPLCGVNLNVERCACEREKADPRLSVLRDMASSRRQRGRK